MCPLSGECSNRRAAHARRGSGDHHHFRTVFTCHVEPPLLGYGRARSVRNICKHIFSLVIRRMAGRLSPARPNRRQFPAGRHDQSSRRNTKEFQLQCC